MAALGDDDVGKALAGLDELEVHGLHRAGIALDDPFHVLAALADVAGHDAHEAVVVVGIHENLDVHLVAELLVREDEDALDDDDAARLQEELDKGFEAPKEPDEFAAVNTDKPSKDTKKEESHYSGPSVLEWSLEGRKASVLKVPAYLGYGAGLVKVIIGVDPQGTVRTVKIDEAASSGDQSLRNYAIRAARTSKFSSSASAPSMQSGYIIYQFIAQ